jgi:LuxR family transcriptional regulator, maltose regulon positive regulatory protein
VAVAYVALARARAWQGRLADAEPLLDHAERALRVEVQPVAGVMLYYLRGLLELARGRNQQALAAFRAGDRLTELLAAGHPVAARVRAFGLKALVSLGQTRRAEQSLAEMDPDEHETTESHVAVAALGLAQDNPPPQRTLLRPS